jgi:hypothetical protein
MNRVTKNVLAAILVCPMLITSGCFVAAVAAVGAAAGIGAYKYVNGRLVQSVSAPLPKAFRACEKAVANLGFTKTDSGMDAFNGHVSARTSDGTDVKIDLKQDGTDSTEIGIRVGVFGDEAKSASIMAEIRKGL